MCPSLPPYQRSRSAFALHSDGNPEPESKDDNPAQPPLQTLKKEGTPIQPSWKSVDRLDNSSKSLELNDGCRWLGEMAYMVVLMFKCVEESSWTTLQLKMLTMYWV